MAAEPYIRVRDDDRKFIGEIADYRALRATPRFNDIGEWVLELDADAYGAALLGTDRNTGGGIVIIRDGQTLISGPILARQWRRDEDTGQGVLQVLGADDNWHLGTRLVYPNPAQTPETTTSTYYRVSSTDAEGIMRDLVLKNLGASALVPRRLAGLTLGTDGDRGHVQASPKYRWDVLLEALQQLSPLSRTDDDPKTDLGFRIAQVGMALQFQVYQPTDRTGTARFSFDFGNLASASWQSKASTATVAIAGYGSVDDDSGKSLAAAYYSREAVDSLYPYRIETFLDATSIDPADVDAEAQLNQQTTEALTNAAGSFGASISAIDTERLQFGVDYQLGDFVSVELPGSRFTAPIREVTLTYTAAEGEVIDVGIGTNSDTAYTRSTSRLVRRVGGLSRVVRKLTTK